jgi:hypothetical protein
VRDVAAALAAGLWAPVRRARLALVLWLARLVPILLFFTLPLYGAAREQLGRQPQARALLDAPADPTGFAWAWTNDFLATRFDVQDRLFWIVLLCWLLVTVLSGGLVASLLHAREPLLAACGRYAGRLVRLALLAAALLYLADAGVNGVLAERHAQAARAHHTQDYAVERSLVRGLLFVAIAFLIGAVHSYARIDLVANDRRSAFLSFARGLGILLTRLPKLLLVETGMLLAAGLAAAVAWVLHGAARPQGDAGWLSLGLFVAAASLGSYLRTGIELGTLAARCRILVPPAPPLSPIETVLTPPSRAA